MALNILIVDDSEIVRAVIKKTFGIAGIETGQIFEAGNGKEALGILQEAWVDLVLADINMPVMNGIEMIEHMTEDEVLKNIPIVVISTEGSLTRIEELRAKGVRAYVRKPFTPEQIKKTVDEITGERS